ncbi:TniQ family protein [Ornithinimicrobium flavum]|uniref:TniQ family protein n=1 Tax=Ornithinimicrobium flavum TaxID=1288636 RepID=UPI00106F7007|nr:TniQ family protein [Ornithinimicrobium flavum]
MQPSTSPARPDRPRAAPPGLREVPGGYDITRWPIAVPPVEDEHVLSWIWRVAHRYGMSVHAALSALGVPSRSSSTRRVQAAVEPHADLLTSQLGPTPLSVGMRSPTSGAVMLEKELDRYLTSYATGRVPAPTFGYCPACLAQTGAWPRAWQTRLPGICTTHEVFLLDRCPDCRHRPFSTPSWMSVTTEPCVCPQVTATGTRPRTTRQRCGTDLRTPQAAPATPEQIALMIRLQAAARSSACYPVDAVTAAGFETTVEEYFDAVLELVDERVGLTSLLNADPRTPGKLLAALRTAFAVLDQDDAHRAAAMAEDRGLLDPQGPHTPIITGHKLRRRRHNRLLGAIRLRSLEAHLSPTAQLTFRTASSMPRYPQHFDGIPAKFYFTALPGQVALNQVPQLIWPGALTPWISDDDLPARAATSMLLAKVGSTRPWSLIALDLGLPARLAPVPTALITRLRRNGEWDAFRQALEDLATTLERDPPPIDYSRRRWAAADRGRLLQAVELARADQAHDLPFSLDPLTVAALTWQTYTGGSLTLHPYLHTVRAPAEADAATLQLVRSTAVWVHELAGCPDTGPLQWQPP